MSQQYYMKQEGGWEPPPGTEEGPAQYAAEVAARIDNPSSGYYYMQHPNARSELLELCKLLLIWGWTSIMVSLELGNAY